MTGPLPTATARGRALARDLGGLIGEGGVSCAPIDLWAAAQDAWPRARLWLKSGKNRFVPDLVCWPRDSGQVAQVLGLAARSQIPVVPFGGGSSGCGAGLPVRGGIALDLKRLAAAPRIDLAGRSVDVRAGVNGGRLEEQLQAAGATLGHFPADRAASTVGGWMATRSGGASAGRYGKIEDLVLSLEAVDGTGAQLRTVDGPSAGPDLAQLLLGSAGTLCVFTAARLRIFPKPRARSRRAVRCQDFAAGLRAAQGIVRAGLRPSRLELLDPLSGLLAGLGGAALPGPLRTLAEAGQHEGLRLLLRAPRLLGALIETLPAASTLLLEFEGEGQGAEGDAEEEGAEALRLCASPGEGGQDLGAPAAERALSAREGSGLPLLGSAGAFVEQLDVAAVWDRLPALAAALQRAAAGKALFLLRLSHAWPDGGALDATLVGPPGLTLEEAFALDPSGRDAAEDDVAAEERAAEECLAAAMSAANDAGATLSHHRGVGLARALALPREHGEGMRALRALKKAFDPRGILNPGKLLL